MASRRIRVTPQAERDIDSEVIYLGSVADVDTAIRFFDAAHATFRDLFVSPGSGQTRLVGNPRLGEVKQCRSKRHRCYSGPARR